MALGKLAILCMLRVANAARADRGGDEFLQSELGLSCDEDKLPSEVDNQYCASYDGNLNGCLENGCRAMDTLSPSGKLSCKAKCKDDSASETSDGLSVPEKVKEAVRKAQRLAREKESAAAERVIATKAAEAEAMQKRNHARQVAEDATESLRQAEARETETYEAEQHMKTALAEAEQKDSDFKRASSEYEVAQSAKQQKLDVMKQALRAKQAQEAEWHMQDEVLKQELLEAKKTAKKLKERLEAERRKAQQLFQRLEAQIAEAEARVPEAGKKRQQVRALRDTEGQRIKAEYMQTVNAYKAEKERVENLGDAAKTAETRNEAASSSARARVAEYWHKVAAARTAADEKVEAKEQSDAAQAAMVEAEFFFIAQSKEMASALKEQAEAKALKDKVENVDKYATVFYEKLQEVNEPDAEDNDMMRVMKLVTDPAMKPCLNSYNIVVRAANELAESNAENILADLKEGLTQINADRASRFRSWAPTEDVARWIWGANKIEKEELNY